MISVIDPTSAKLWERTIDAVVILAQIITPVAVAWIAWKQSQANQIQASTNRNVVALEKNMNSMREELVLTTGQAEKAKGVIEGRRQVENETKTPPV